MIENQSSSAVATRVAPLAVARHPQQQQQHREQIERLRSAGDWRRWRRAGVAGCQFSRELLFSFRNYNLTANAILAATASDRQTAAVGGQLVGGLPWGFLHLGFRTKQSPPHHLIMMAL